ncbi:cell division cycle protein 123 homolog [Uloborus diversus]|uniref:cell division cycle protein 123 homolog n=1 Tax=Uloborus diversus TaxID=327109 RepID=UPI002409CFE8|nr:cell division cycle protein 123 homolog [Uloborus diversus]
MKVEDVQKCSFQNWYHDFRNVTFKSIILPLPDGFVSYILKDGIVLPKRSSYTVEVKESGSDSEDDWDSIEDDEAEAPHFPEFDEQIKSAINCLSGKVFPKLNWSSPKDASWIAFNNSCCCTTVSDVYLLLKSSDFIVHDLTKPYSFCEDYIPADTNCSLTATSEKFHLILRKWVEIDTAGEFRCFVKNTVLIGICQREHSLYFEHIAVEKNDIVQDISDFFHQHIQFNFSSPNYVFDVYRKKKGKVYLIDFNPFGKVTEPLMFNWAELCNGSVNRDNNGRPEFRYISTNHGVQPRPLSYHAIPRDIVDISTGEDSLKLVDLIRLKLDEENRDLNVDTDERNGIS